MKVRPAAALSRRRSAYPRSRTQQLVASRGRKRRDDEIPHSGVGASGTQRKRKKRETGDISERYYAQKNFFARSIAYELC